MSFYLRESSVLTGSKGFTATFGSGSLAFTEVGAAYTLGTFTTTATAASTTLSFAAYNSPVYYLLDDVSVAPVPEPSAFAALGLGAVAMLRRRKRA